MAATGGLEPRDPYMRSKRRVKPKVRMKPKKYPFSLRHFYRQIIVRSGAYRLLAFALSASSDGRPEKNVAGSQFSAEIGRILRTAQNSAPIQRTQRKIRRFSTAAFHAERQHTRVDLFPTVDALVDAAADGAVAGVSDEH